MDYLLGKSSTVVQSWLGKSTTHLWKGLTKRETGCTHTGLLQIHTAYCDYLHPEFVDWAFKRAQHSAAALGAQT